MLTNRWRSRGTAQPASRQDQQRRARRPGASARAARGQEREHAGREAEPAPRACRWRRGPPSMTSQSGRNHAGAPRARQEPRQGREQHEGQDARQGHVDAEESRARGRSDGRASAACPASGPGRGQTVDLQQPDHRGHAAAASVRPKRNRSAAPASPQGIGGDVEGGDQQQALAAGRGSPADAPDRSAESSVTAAEGEHRRHERPALRPPARRDRAAARARAA